ncbi:MAG: DinB family protein [Anaerolineaceae bacterium]|jgi:uncharacterized damage-inducible protein DinB
METFFEEYVNRLQELHQEIKDAIKGLPQEALDWVPGKDMNSLVAIVTHLAGSERASVGGTVGGIPVNRDRAAEFLSKGSDEAALVSLLDDSLEVVRSVCAKLTLKDLEAKRIRPRDQHEVTVSWILLHAFDHAALHLGHIQITRQMWDQRK